MLFKTYDSVFITEDRKTIKTGIFRYYFYKGDYLTDVYIEEDSENIKIHGYKKDFAHHSDGISEQYKIPKDKWNLYCIRKKDFYIYKPNWFFKLFFRMKEQKKLKKGNYMKKECKEVCFIFPKDNLVEEYSV